MALSLKSVNSVRAAARPARQARAVQVRAAAADRPLWFPGNKAPAHLDGTLAGDFGFDPLSLGAVPDNLKWFVQAELVHARWAMLGVAGILFTEAGNKVGGNFPEWWEAGKIVAAGNNPPGVPSISYGTQVMVMHIFMGWVEMKRFMDFRNPGSQAEGPFYSPLPWVPEALKGKENAYPGGPFFDPLGMSADEANYKRMKESEIRNGRLAMVAFLGFVAQHDATGKGAIDNLVDHLADPYHVTFTTNGHSLPFAH